MTRPKPDTQIPLHEMEQASDIHGEVHDLSDRYLGTPPSESFYVNPEPNYGSLHKRFDQALTRRLKRAHGSHQ